MDAAQAMTAAAARKASASSPSSSSSTSSSGGSRGRGRGAAAAAGLRPNPVDLKYAELGCDLTTMSADDPDWPIVTRYEEL